MFFLFWAACQPGVVESTNQSRTQQLSSFVEEEGRFAVQMEDLVISGQLGGIEVAAKDQSWSVNLAVSGVGRGQTVQPLEPALSEAIGSGWRRVFEGGVVERLLNHQGNVEHQVVLPSPPTGTEGAVRVAFSVDDGGVRRGPDGPRLLSADGISRFDWSGLTVVDSSGQILASEIAYGDDFFEVLFDDADAVYPVVVDPLLLKFSYTVSFGDSTGIAVATSERWLASLFGIAGDQLGLLPHGGSFGKDEITLSLGKTYASVAISPPFVAVGSPAEDMVRVFFYSPEFETWVAQQTINGVVGSSFGESLALEGGTLVIGAPTGGAFGQGEVVVRTGEGLYSEFTISSDSVLSTTGFGSSVAVDDGAIVIGAPGQGGAGEVVLYEQDGTLLSLTPGTLQNGDNYGQAVGVDANEIVVGAVGKAFVWRRAGDGSWQSILIEAPPEISTDFGANVAIEGATLLVGNTNEFAQFSLVVDDWLLSNVFGYGVGEGNLAFSDGVVVGGNPFESEVWFSRVSSDEMVLVEELSGLAAEGVVLEMEGEQLFVGLPDSDVLAFNAGEVRVYERQGLEWQLLRTLLPPTADPGQRFGGALSASGGVLAIGAPFLDGTNAREGAVYLYDDLGATGTYQVVEPNSLGMEAAATSDLAFGWSLALRGDVLLVGATGLASGGAHEPEGGYQRFEFDGVTWNFSGTRREGGGESIAFDGQFVVLADPRADTVKVISPAGVEQTLTGAAGFGDHISLGSGILLISEGTNTLTYTEVVGADHFNYHDSFTGGGASSISDGLLYLAQPSGDLYVVETDRWKASTIALGADFGVAVSSDWGVVAIANEVLGEVVLYKGDTQLAPIVRDDVVEILEGDGPVTIHPLDNDLDPEGLPLELNVTGSSTLGSLTVVGDTVTFTPLSNDINGMEFIGYRAVDSEGLYRSGSIRISVIAVDDPPQPFDDDAIVLEDSDVLIDVLSNDVEVDCGLACLTVAISDAPNHGVVEIEGQSVRYTPDENFWGADSFVYLAIDDVGTAIPATVNITVEPVDDPPIIGDMSLVTSEDVLLVVNAPGVLESAVDIDDDTLDISSWTTPKDSTVEVFDSGRFTFLPAPDFNGTVVFSIFVTDGTTVVESVITVDVLAVNDAPIANPDEFFGVEDSVISWNTPGVRDNDVDENVANTVLTVVTQPQYGDFTLLGDGSGTYTPEDNFNGTDFLEYQLVDDGGLLSDVARVRFIVEPVPDDAVIPSGLSYLLTGEELRTLAIEAPGVLINITDIDGDTPQVTSVLEPPEEGVLTVQPNGSFNLEFYPGWFGEVSFTLELLIGEEEATREVVVVAEDPRLADCPQWFLDGDGDGFGVSPGVFYSCQSVEGFVNKSGDCDDSNGNINPGEVEVCNELDDDCSGEPDDGLEMNTYFLDSDGDGFGDAAVQIVYCEQPSDYTTNKMDCADDSAAIHPGASEITNNGVDEDCDGVDNELHAVGACSQGGHGGSLLPLWLSVVFLRRRS